MNAQVPRNIVIYKAQKYTEGFQKDNLHFIAIYINQTIFYKMYQIIYVNDHNKYKDKTCKILVNYPYRE